MTISSQSGRITKLLGILVKQNYIFIPKRLDICVSVWYTIVVARACVQAFDTSMVWRQTSPQEEARNRYGPVH